MSDNQDLRQRTRQLALTISRAGFSLQTPARLVEQAKRWDRERQESPGSSEYRRALAQVLLDVYEVLDARIRQSGLSDLVGRRGPLGLWADNPNSPLLGALVDVAPFQNYDVWAIEAQTAEPMATPRRRRRRPPRPDPRPVAPTPVGRPDRGRTPGPIGVGRLLAERARSRPGELQPGFVDEALDFLPAGTRQVGVPLAALVLRFVEPMVGGVLGAINNFFTLLNTLDSANRTLVRESRALGVRHGLIALRMLPPVNLAAGRIRAGTLVGIATRHQEMTRQRERQKTFAGASGPDLATQSMDEGIATIARAANQVLDEVQPRVEAEMENVTPDQRIEIRRQILDALVQETQDALRTGP